MTKEDIKIICNIISAFSTCLGVGAAIAYYLKIILNFSTTDLAIVIIIYFSWIISIILYYNQKLKEEKNGNNKMD